VRTTFLLNYEAFIPFSSWMSRKFSDFFVTGQGSGSGCSFRVRSRFRRIDVVLVSDNGKGIGTSSGWESGAAFVGDWKSKGSFVATNAKRMPGKSRVFQTGIRGLLSRCLHSISGTAASDPSSHVLFRPSLRRRRDFCAVQSRHPLFRAKCHPLSMDIYQRMIGAQPGQSCRLSPRCSLLLVRGLAQKQVELSRFSATMLRKGTCEGAAWMIVHVSVTRTWTSASCEPPLQYRIESSCSGCPSLST
jgi:hypothetical protein